MPFIPHTPDEVTAMLSTIGMKDLSGLFDEIPANLQTAVTENIPAGLNEYEVTRLIHERAQQMQAHLCFIGAGAYEHVIPAAVWEVATRGEWLTAYTPYQPEASQGSLQLMYEYQSMMASLMEMAVSNASLYDGASALAEAILMAVRASTHPHADEKVILIAGSLHPHYATVAKTITQAQGIRLLTVPFDPLTGTLSLSVLTNTLGDHPLALVIPQPNFFGQLEAVDTLTDWAHAEGLSVIAVVNPIAMALLKAPGTWGENGADIVCGEGQPLGIPLNGGGPYFGFMCTRLPLIRQLPGRIVGRTLDSENREGFVMTLQAREQHIRRAKATSNICTNQGLMVVAATIFMSLMGPAGLTQMALKSYQQTERFLALVTQIPGVTRFFPGPHFHEIVLCLPQTATAVIEKMSQKGIAAGYDMSEYFPAYTHHLLVCITETKTEADLQAYVNALQEVLTVC